MDKTSTYGYLFGSPCIQIDGFDPGDVNAQVPVDSGTADAEEDAQIPWRPARSWNTAQQFMNHMHFLIWSAPKPLLDDRLKIWQRGTTLPIKLLWQFI